MNYPELQILVSKKFLEYYRAKKIFGDLNLQVSVFNPAFTSIR